MSEAAAKKRSSQRDGKGGPGDTQDGVAPKVALKLMKDMLLFRRFEEKAAEAYAIGKIGGFCHLHTGQEGSAAGTIGALREDDYVSSVVVRPRMRLTMSCDHRVVDGATGARFLQTLRAMLEEPAAILI